jgi:hypothetical protein
VLFDYTFFTLILWRLVDSVSGFVDSMGFVDFMSMFVVSMRGFVDSMREFVDYMGGL